MKLATQLLNKIDACIYITDLHSDEILFVNNNMLKEYGITNDVVGKTCWSVFQTGFCGRCEFCPNNELAKDPSKTIVWEECSTSTGKYYRNTDTVVEWADGRLAHMQHSVDIDFLKKSEVTLNRRLEQQRLMSAIAQSFAGTGVFGDLINNALKLIGEFLNADIVYITDINTAGNSWQWTKDGAHVERKPDDNDITVPMYVGKKLWGYFGFYSENGINSDEGDEHLAQLLSGVFAVALERNEAEEKLFNAEQTLNAIINSLPVAIFWKDANSHFQGCNSAMTELYGITPEQIIGSTSYSLIDDESAQIMIDDDNAVMQTGEAQNRELWITFKSGRRHFLHMTKTLVRNEAGNPILIVGIMNDITERKETEKKLLRMSAVIENSPRYCSYVNREGRFAYFNQAAYDITGYSREELMAGGVQIMFDEESNKRIFEEIMPAVYEKGIYEYELPLICKNGDVRIMAFTSFLVGDDEYNCATICDDVTERKILENDLMNKKLAAEQANLAKTDFLSRMSHEIRTPMNAIIGMTKIASMSNDIQKKQYCLDKIDTASVHLMDIINDILDVAKIEADKMELSLCEFEFEKMMHDAAAVVQFTAEEKKQVLVTELDPNLPDFIISDELRLRQVITNLLSNAVKFTGPGGKIKLTARVDSIEQNELTLRISVEDTGIGIKNNQIDTLFDAFEQADGSISRRYGGSGLGLTICKKLVELMGGNIWVKSTLGKGSVFTFIIKAGLSKAHKSAVFRHADHDDNMIPDLNGRRILLVEDIAVNREIVVSVLAGTGVTIDHAVNGKHALDIIQEDAQRYDLILMDVHMPVMDGYEASRRIRAIDSQAAKTIPIIAMTADVFTEDIRKCREAGMDDHVGKPVDIKELMDKINKHLDTERIAAEPVKESAPPAELDASLINFDEGMSRVLGNRKLYVKLLAKFLDSDLPVQVCAALDSNDPAAIKTAAHTLKGVAANLSLVALEQISKNIEAAIGNCAEYEQLKATLNEITEKTMKLISEVMAHE